MPPVSIVDSTVDNFVKRFRVTPILTHLDETEVEQDIVNTLRWEELISPEQYQKLMVDDAVFDPQTIVMVIKDTKVGRGLKFLPSELTDLKSEIQSALNEENIAEKYTGVIRWNIQKEWYMIKWLSIY